MREHGASARIAGGNDMSDLEQVKAMIQKHCPKISRLRLMALIGIAAVFTWILLGAKRVQS
jgi:hypothetical protein